MDEKYPLYKQELYWLISNAHVGPSLANECFNILIEAAENLPDQLFSDLLSLYFNWYCFLPSTGDLVLSSLSESDYDTFYFFNHEKIFMNISKIRYSSNSKSDFYLRVWKYILDTFTEETAAFALVCICNSSVIPYYCKDYTDHDTTNVDMLEAYSALASRFFPAFQNIPQKQSTQETINEIKSILTELNEDAKSTAMLFLINILNIEMKKNKFLQWKILELIHGTDNSEVSDGNSKSEKELYS